MHRRGVYAMTVPADASLDVLTAVTPLGDGRFTADLPDGWQQGRGLFGGLVTAVLVRALQASAPDRELRSLTAELCGPTLPGPAELRVEVLRVGSAVSTLAVRLVQGGLVQAHGVGVLGRARANDLDGTRVTAPAMADWRSMERLPLQPPIAPTFTRYFDFRSARLPFSGGESVTEGWIRPANPGLARDSAWLAACIDAWWPTLFQIETRPRPMATIAFTFQPQGDFVGLDPEAPLFHRAWLVSNREGYAVEYRELWGHDGRLMATNQQTIAVIA